MKTKAKGLFEEAFLKLDAANAEYCRPEEDVVSYLVCNHSQVAIENFLRGYLLKHEISPENYTNINELYKKCVEINYKFKEIDLSNFSCKSNGPDSRSCNSVSKVSGCLEIADNLNSFLKKEKVY